MGERSFSCFLESDSLVFKGLCQCYAVHGLQDMETLPGWRAACDGAAILSPACQQGSCGLFPVYTFWLQESRLGAELVPLKGCVPLAYLFFSSSQPFL